MNNESERQLAFLARKAHSQREAEIKTVLELAEHKTANEHQLAFLENKAKGHKGTEAKTLVKLAEHIFKGGGRQIDMQKILKNNGYTLSEAKSNSDIFRYILADEVLEGRMTKAKAQTY